MKRKTIFGLKSAYLNNIIYKIKIKMLSNTMPKTLIIISNGKEKLYIIFNDVNFVKFHEDPTYLPLKLGTLQTITELFSKDINKNHKIDNFGIRRFTTFHINKYKFYDFIDYYLLPN